MSEEAIYVDAKGRRRWHCNDALAEKLKELYDYLVIGNYEESHAARYPKLAHTISRSPDSIEVLAKEGKLSSISGVSKVIAGIITELLETGSCQKMDDGDEYFTPPPRSVLELTKIPRLGAKNSEVALSGPWNRRHGRIASRPSRRFIVASEGNWKGHDCYDRPTLRNPRE